MVWIKQSQCYILIYGLASASIATAMIFDGSAKLLLVQVIEEKSLPSSEGKQNQQQSGESNDTSYDVFIYKSVDKYQGECSIKWLNLRVPLFMLYQHQLDCSISM